MKEKIYKYRVKSEGLISDHYLSIYDHPCLNIADRCYSLENSLSYQLHKKAHEIIVINEIL